MARMPRFFVPGLPLHVIQRGNDRAPIFVAPEDLSFFRECVQHAMRKHDVALHAYVFMTNHVHLLATPGTATSIAKMMQGIGRVYVQYFNTRYQRTGTLWEGRYKAAIVESERYLLACMRYIELNPVRAGMVAGPSAYPWSSHRANTNGAIDALIRPHPVYLQLGNSEGARQAAYTALFGSEMEERDLFAIRDATQNGWALGSATFRETIGAIARRGERLPRGRPRKGQRDSDQNRV